MRSQLDSPQDRAGQAGLLCPADRWAPANKLGAWIHAVALLPSLLFALPQAAGAQVVPSQAPAPVTTDRGTSVPDELKRLAVEDSRVHEPLVFLADTIGSRLSGSEGLQRATEWSLARFRELGLEARLEHWGDWPVGFERGDARGGIVHPVERDFPFGTPAWTPGTAGEVRAVARVAPSSTEELLAAPDHWRGTWVLGWPRDRRPGTEQRAAVSATLVDLGIAGWITNAGAVIRSFGEPPSSEATLPSLVQIQILEADYDDVIQRLGRGDEVELAFDIENRFTPGPVPQFNVVADLLGSEFPGEYVIVGGHLDSWDGSSCAQDNATGCATTLEAARLLVEAGARPRRTIRFVLWTGEEQGLLGSRGYVEAHAAELERISAVLVHDGGTNYISGLSAPAQLVPQLELAFAPVVESGSTLPFAIRRNNGLSLHGSSDHVPYVRAGVPAFHWDQSGRADYGLIHHTAQDTLEHVVPAYQRRSALVVALGALGLANLDQLLRRDGLLDPAHAARQSGLGETGRRYMGVRLDGREIVRVLEGSMAAKAGWQPGDLILSIDGVRVNDTEEVTRELQSGGPKKRFRLQRGERVLDSVLDYGGATGESTTESAEGG